VAVAVPPSTYANQTYSGTLTLDGYKGHTYQFRVRTRDGHGYLGAWSPPATSAISGSASLSHPFRGMYTLDAFGGVAPDASPYVKTTAYWPGWSIARAGHAYPGAGSPQSGLVLDGYGGLHQSGPDIVTVNTSAYW